MTVDQIILSVCGGALAIVGLFLWWGAQRVFTKLDELAKQITDQFEKHTASLQKVYKDIHDSETMNRDRVDAVEVCLRKMIEDHSERIAKLEVICESRRFCRGDDGK